ncbi:hypothetical protein [Psychroserpens jangbogonensis]|uniref:hypothetical protein n=1 Tax=Psychroserpens jangbogonensis TaxID=1484460 RepID=UPI00068E8BDF|nr:hypothetical protein [Psychroserpens jangbogonensis]
MKKALAILFCLASIVAIGQNKDYAINLGAYVPDQIENVPASAKKMLINKLGQLVTANGISNNQYNARFIITPNIVVAAKEIMPTAPVKVVLNLDITLYIGDGISGTLYASETFNVKGVGTTETKAYMQAIKRLKPKNEAMQGFISRGKDKILDYYNSNCSQIQKEAQSLENSGQLEDALGVMLSIPSSSTCYDKSKTKLKALFIKAINQDCKLRLNEAQAIWSANQDIEAANETARILSSIHPEANCFSSVKSLFSKIEARVKDLQDRDWNYKLKVLDATKSYYDSAFEVSMARAKNQPSTVMYNVRGWY